MVPSRACRMRFSRNFTVLVVAVATMSSVMSRSAAAAAAASPQTQTRNDAFGGAPQLTINGQTCQCVLDIICNPEKDTIISIPQGSKNCGNNPGLVCCQMSQDPFATPEEVPSEASTTQKPYKPSTKNPPTFTENTYEVDQKPMRDCLCVPPKQCLVEKYDKLPNIDIRTDDCSSGQMCCNKGDIINSDFSENTQNEPVRSCGVGSPAPNDYSDLGTRIISPEDKAKTYVGQFPWIAVILKTSINSKTGEKLNNVFQCGASLIHPQVIITAAHCVSDQDINSLKVRVGEWDTQSNEDVREKYPHQDIPISKIIVHPEHHNGTMFNDVALVHLSYAVSLKQHINTICIPTDKYEDNYDPHSCISIGWGKNGFGGKDYRYQNILKKVHLSIVPHSTCQTQLRQTRLGDYFILDESFICAGGVKDEDVCRGDGGGPLMCLMNKGNSNKKKYIQVGIVSWGIGCGDENVPGVYSSLVKNVQWINKQIKYITQ